MFEFFLLRSLLLAWAGRHAIVEGADGLEYTNPIRQRYAQEVRSKACDRYEQYRNAFSIAQAAEKKAGYASDIARSLPTELQDPISKVET